MAGTRRVFGFAGDIYAAAFYSSALTAPQIAQNEQAMRSYLGQTKGVFLQNPVNYSGNLLAFMGDSITSGQGVSGVLSTSWTAKAMQFFPNNFEPWNFGISGDTLSDMNSRRNYLAGQTHCPKIYRKWDRSSGGGRGK